MGLGKLYIGVNFLYTDGICRRGTDGTRLYIIRFIIYEINYACLFVVPDGRVRVPRLAQAAALQQRLTGRTN